MFRAATLKLHTGVWPSDKKEKDMLSTPQFCRELNHNGSVIIMAGRRQQRYYCFWVVAAAEAVDSDIETTNTASHIYSSDVWCSCSMVRGPT